MYYPSKIDFYFVSVFVLLKVSNNSKLKYWKMMCHLHAYVPFSCTSFSLFNSTAGSKMFGTEMQKNAGEIVHVYQQMKIIGVLDFTVSYNALFLYTPFICTFPADKVCSININLTTVICSNMTNKISIREDRWKFSLLVKWSAMHYMYETVKSGGIVNT